LLLLPCCRKTTASLSRLSSHLKSLRLKKEKAAYESWPIAVLACGKAVKRLKG